MSNEEFESKVLFHLDKLDGHCPTAISFITGLSEKDLDDLGGFPDEAEQFD